MSSSIAWLDIDDAERRKMRELVALFRVKGAVDELAIGRIRDAFSDRLFPGTSTLWSRAKYLLFVPWLFELLAEGKGGRGSGDEQLRGLQRRLARTLRDEHPDGRGIIGVTGVDVQQPPDVILWAALDAWGVRVSPTTRVVARDDCAARGRRKSRLEDDQELLSSLWHPGLPKVPSGFPDTASLDLNNSQAGFLRDLALAEDALPGTQAAFRKDSLLARMVESGCPDDLDRPWLHPAPGASAPLSDAMRHAGHFSLAIHGARVLYSLMVAEARDDEDMVERAKEELARWASDVERALPEDFGVWLQELDPFWVVVKRLNPRISHEVAFVDAWAGLVGANPHGLSCSTAARRLVLDREHQAKGAKLARLAKDGGVGRDGRAVIPAPLDYRWAEAKSVVNDIQSGLQN